MNITDIVRKNLQEALNGKGYKTTITASETVTYIRVKSGPYIGIDETYTYIFTDNTILINNADPNHTQKVLDVISLVAPTSILLPPHLPLAP